MLEKETFRINKSEEEPQDENDRQESPSESMYTLMEKIKNPKLNDTERAGLFKKIQEKYETAKPGEHEIEMLRHAITGQDRAELRFAVDKIQDAINAGYPSTIDSMNVRATDEELDDFLSGKTHQIYLSVSSGSKGSRVFIHKNKIAASEDSHFGQLHQENFRRLFGIANDDPLEVTF